MFLKTLSSSLLLLYYYYYHYYHYHFYQGASPASPAGGDGDALTAGRLVPGLLTAIIIIIIIMISSSSSSSSTSTSTSTSTSSSSSSSSIIGRELRYSYHYPCKKELYKLPTVPKLTNSTAVGISNNKYV